MTWLRSNYVKALGWLTIATYFAIYATPLIPRAQVRHFSERWAMSVGLLVVLVALIDRIRRIGHFEERLFWGLQTVALALWLVGLQCLHSTVESVAYWGEPACIASYLVFALSIDRQPHRESGWSRRSTGFKYSAVGTLLFMLGVILYFYVTPFLFDGRDYSASTFYLYIALDALIALRFLHLTVACKDKRWRFAYALLASAGLIWITSDTVDRLIDAGVVSLPYGSAWDLVWLLPLALLFGASRTPAKRGATTVGAGNTSIQVDASGSLVAYAVLFPAFHLTLGALDLRVPEGRAMREAVVLGALLAFLALAVAQHRALRKTAEGLRSALTVLVMNDQVQQSQKMEAIGRLAGGIAHDFNNLLMVLRSYSDLLLKTTNPGEPSRHYTEQVGKATDRAASLTHQLLTFSRKQVLKVETVNPNDAIDEATTMLSRLIDERIRLQVVQEPSIGGVNADTSQLVQAIINLAINARDAMPDGGTLTLESSNVTLTRHGVQAGATLPPGRYVQIAVSDTGHGMDEATRERVFEPFFTGKAKGTGLGLASVYGIAVQSGGQVYISSRPGEGTTFTIRLPRAEGPPKIQQPTTPPTTSHVLRTILLVDDEPEVLSAIREMLDGIGCEVLEAGSGAEALQVCAARQEPIDLLLTDVVMPGMTGWETAERVRTLHPETRAIFMSGYAGDAIDLEAARDVSFVRKPFTQDDLLARLRELFGLEEERKRTKSAASNRNHPLRARPTLKDRA